MVNGKDFEKMDRIALEFLNDYQLYSFPLDIFKIVTDILNAKIVYYSSLNNEQLEYIKNKDPLDKGYTVVEHLSNGNIRYIIYINDSNCLARQRYTLAHEIKHILCGEEKYNKDEEKLADYFAKILLAPKCIIIENNYFSQEEITSFFGLSLEASRNHLIGINNRINSYGFSLFDFEREYMNNYCKFNKIKKN